MVYLTTVFDHKRSKLYIFFRRDKPQTEVFTKVSGCALAPGHYAHIYDGDRICGADPTKCCDYKSDGGPKPSLNFCCSKDRHFSFLGGLLDVHRTLF